MDDITTLAEKAHQVFEIRTRARDQALLQARQLTRNSAHAIRSIHRGEVENAQQLLGSARELVIALQNELQDFPDLFYAGYTQDAIKEYCEAAITFAIVQDQSLPTPEALGAGYATFMNGLAEVPGELRRRCLDLLRQGYSPEAERLLNTMDEIYAELVTMDYPDAITYGLRRQTDLVRGIVERTRADLTLSLREEKLLHAIDTVNNRLNSNPH
jgi:translin